MCIIYIMLIIKDVRNKEKKINEKEFNIRVWVDIIN